MDARLVLASDSLPLRSLLWISRPSGGREYRHARKSFESTNPLHLHAAEMGASDIPLIQLTCEQLSAEYLVVVIQMHITFLNDWKAGEMEMKFIDQFSTSLLDNETAAADALISPSKIHPPTRQQLPALGYTTRIVSQANVSIKERQHVHGLPTVLPECRWTGSET